MKVGGIKKAFAHYGATLDNVNWAVSALVGNDVVLSLWQHRFRGSEYRDSVSRWSGHGNALFRRHLQQAFDEKRRVRLVVAITSDPAAVDRGEDASTLKNSYSVRPDLVGHITAFDGDAFTIRFERAPIAS